MQMHDHDKIIEAWASGEDSVFIANRVQTSPGYVRSIIKMARERGDKRAIEGGPLKRGAKGNRKLDHEFILDRWMSGWLAKDIARSLNTSDETIYGILMAHRRRGDPRAGRRRRENGKG